MKKQTLTDRQAYDHYHRHYQNTTYRQIQRCVLQDMIGTDHVDYWAVLKGEPILSLHNAVTDAALGICGVSGYQDGIHCLTLKVIEHKLSETTLQAIAAHLRLFERTDDTSVEDFVATVTTLQHIQLAQETLQEGIAAASLIHSPAGQAAYDLLNATTLFLRSAHILLMEGDTGYCREKFAVGADYLKHARKYFQP